MSAKKKKRTKKAAKKRVKKTLTVKESMQDVQKRHGRLKNYTLERVTALQGELDKLVSLMDKANLRLSDLEEKLRARDREVHRLHGLVTAGSAWAGRADEWAKRFCNEVAKSFRAGAVSMERSGDGGAQKDELREEQVVGAVNIIRSGLKLLDEAEEEEP